MKSPDPRTFSRDAFTLMELLVSLVVIAILATLAGSAVIKVMETSHTAKCAGNLKSIGIAMRMYMADNNGWPPPHVNYPFHNLEWQKVRWNWMTWLSPYLIHDTSVSPVPMPSVFDCPADPNVKTWPKPRPYIPTSSTDTNPVYRLGSYGYNYYHLTTANSWWKPDLQTWPRNVNAISNPARLILVTDGREDGGIDINPYSNPPTDARPARRHGKHFNAVFLDGHVEAMEEKAASDWKTYWIPQ